MLSAKDVVARQGQIINRVETLNQKREDVSLATIELKSITAIAPHTPVRLTSHPKDVFNKNNIVNSHHIDDLIIVALQNRPETREQYAKKNIAIRNTQQELMRTFPGLNLIFTRNYDSNSFLDNSTWSNFSAALTQSLNNIISLPTRYRASRNQEKLEEAQRLALTAAIIAQVHISRLRIDIAEDNYKTAVQRAKIQRKAHYATTRGKDFGGESGFTKILTEADSVDSTIAETLAFAELQRAYIDMMGTLGLSVMGDQDEVSS
jgi:hypothetical protein